MTRERAPWNLKAYTDVKTVDDDYDDEYDYYCYDDDDDCSWPLQMKGALIVVMFLTKEIRSNITYESVTKNATDYSL